MIEKQLILNLVSEVLQRIPVTQATHILNAVESLVTQRDLFPSREMCAERGVDYRDYSQKNLNAQDKAAVLDVLWGLISERVLMPGDEQSNYNFPLVQVTPFGHKVLSELAPSYHDPSAYMENLKRLLPALDPIVEQYVSEALLSFKRQLVFASAVMIGAAAEKSVLLLLEALLNSVTDDGRRMEIV